MSFQKQQLGKWGFVLRGRDEAGDESISKLFKSKILKKDKF